MAADMNIPMLGSLPMDRALTQLAEEGKSYLEHRAEAAGSQIFQQIVRKIITAVEGGGSSSEGGMDVDAAGTGGRSKEVVDTEIAAVLQRQAELQCELGRVTGQLSQLQAERDS